MKGYENYGGRGITVCDRWLRFENFLADMGERPEGHSIGRINNDGNYEPGNCEWQTPEVQNNVANKRPRKEWQKRLATLRRFTRSGQTPYLGFKIK